MPDPSDSRRFAAGQSDPAGWLTLDTIETGGDWSAFGNAEALVAAAGRALAAHPRFRDHGPAQACIALSGDSNVRALNAQFRGKDKATNVLSFPAPRGLDPATGAHTLGDVVMAQETLAAEASQQGIPPAHHLQHLVIHGLLHLLGLDHESDTEAAVMEAIEVEVLASLGIDSPYDALPASGPPSKTPMSAGAR